MKGISQERLILAVFVAVLVLAVTFPVMPARLGRTLLLLLGIMALRALTWSDGWRAAVWLGAAAIFVLHRDLQGFPYVISLYLVGEAIEFLRAHPRLWPVALTTLAALALGESLHGLIQALNLDPTTCVIANDGMTCQPWIANHVVGYQGERDSYAALLALTAPALAWAGWTVSGWPVAIIPLAVALVLAKTAAAPVALAVAGGWYAWTRWPRMQWPIVGLTTAALVGYLTVVDAPGMERLAAWQATALELPQRPWLGTGLGGFAAATFYDTRLDHVWRQAHNEWLQWAFETGALGVIVLGVYLGRLVRRLWCLPSTPLIITIQAMLIIAAVLAHGHFIAHVPMTAIVIITALGLAEGLTHGGPYASVHLQ